MMSLKFLEYFSWSATNMWQFDLHFRWFWAIWWAGKCHLCLSRNAPLMKTHAHITFSCRWICVKDDNFQARTMHSNKCMAITGDSFNFDGSEFSTTSWDETHSTCMISWQIFTQLVITNVTDGSGNLAQLVAFDASQIGTAYNGIWQRYSSQLWSFLFYAYIYIHYFIWVFHVHFFWKHWWFVGIPNVFLNTVGSSNSEKNVSVVGYAAMHIPFFPTLDD